ncbi:MAG: hypothetical protein QXE74_04080 [Candidatus Bathyarchaeia archaeon]
MFDVELRRTVNNAMGELVEIRIPVTVHPSKTGVVIINSHGLGGSKDGYNGKYVKIAEYLRSLGVGSVVRYHSSLFPFAFQNVDMDTLLVGNFMAVIEYVMEDSLRVCGSRNPEIYLAGFSAGASTSAAIAYEFPQVKKMLLISPSADINTKMLRKGLSEYRGELYVTVGDNDPVLSPEAARTILGWAEKAKVKKIAIVPNCDHQFTGERNGRILSKAYLWAFNGEETYPSPERGIKLY